MFGHVVQRAYLIEHGVGIAVFARFHCTTITRSRLTCKYRPGIQYQHSSWRDLIKSIGGMQSMSGEGDCYDKAFMENLFGHVKTEMYHGETFTSLQAFYRAIDDCIPWYNNECIPKRLKGLTLIRSPAVCSAAPCTRNFSLNRPAHPATIFIPGALANG